MPSISCSATNRSKIRLTEWRCLRGASRSTRNIASIAGLQGTRRESHE